MEKLNVTQEFIDMLNSEESQNVDGWTFFSKGKTLMEEMEKHDISPTEFWYLDEDSRKSILEKVDIKVRPKVNMVMKYWNPEYKISLEDFPGNLKKEKRTLVEKPQKGTVAPVQRTEKVETSNKSKIRDKFETPYPKYKKDNWKFLEELDKFIFKESVTKDELKTVIKKSMPEDVLDNIKTYEEVLKEEWNIETHAETIFKILDPKKNKIKLHKELIDLKPQPDESIYQFFNKFMFYAKVNKKPVKENAETYINCIPETWQAIIMDTHTNSDKEIDTPEQIQKIIESKVLNTKEMNFFNKKLEETMTKKEKGEVEKKKCAKCKKFIKTDSKFDTCFKCGTEKLNKGKKKEENEEEKKTPFKGKQIKVICFHCGGNGHTKAKCKDINKQRTTAGIEAEKRITAQFSTMTEVKTMMDQIYSNMEKTSTNEETQNSSTNESSSNMEIQSLFYRIASKKENLSQIIAESGIMSEEQIKTHEEENFMEKKMKITNSKLIHAFKRPAGKIKINGTEIEAYFDTLSDHSHITKGAKEICSIDNISSNKVKLQFGEDNFSTVADICTATLEFKDYIPFNYNIGILDVKEKKFIIGNDLINLLSLKVPNDPDVERIEEERKIFNIKKVTEDTSYKDQKSIPNKDAEKYIELLKQDILENKQTFKKKTKLPEVEIKLPPEIWKKGLFIKPRTFNEYITIEQIKMNKELLDLDFVEILTYQEEIKTGRFNTPQSRIINDTKTRFVMNFNLTINRFILLGEETKLIGGILEFLSKLEKGMIVVKIDLLRGFWQLSLKPECRNATAYTINQERFRWKVLPLGCNLSPLEFHSIIQGELQKIFKDEKEGTFLKFQHIDDILIAATNIEELFRIVKKLIQHFTSINLAINWEKSELFMDSLTIFGFYYDLKSGEILPEKKKLGNPFEWPRPTGDNKKKLIQIYQGIFTYYRFHEEELQEKIKILQEGEEWTKEKEETWKNLIHGLFTKVCMLDLKQKEIKIIFKSDASIKAAGATLYQKMDDGKLKVLGFFSKTFNETQRRISTPLRELLAGVWGMECFAEILTRFSFTWTVDATAISNSLNEHSKQSENLLRNALWFRILEFNYKIVHIPRTKNVDADLFSNLYSIRSVTKDYNQGKLNDKEVIEELHQETHFNPTRLNELLTDLNIKIKNSLEICKTTSKKCDICLKMNYIPTKFLMDRFVINEPLRNMMVDIFEPGQTTPRGFRYILSMICTLTDFVIMKPLIKKDATEMLMAIIEISPLMGQINELKADNAFTPVKVLANSLGLDLKLNIAHEHTSMSKVERANKTGREILLKTALEKFGSKKDWDLGCTYANINLNIQNGAFKKCFGKSWYSLNTESNEISKEEELQMLEKYWKFYKSETIPALQNYKKVTFNMKAFDNRKRNFKLPKIGDLVFWRIPEEVKKNKLENRYVGPFKIRNITKEGKYELTNNKYYFYSSINHLKTGISNEMTLTRENVPVTKFKIEGGEGEISDTDTSSEEEETEEHLDNQKETSYQNKESSKDEKIIEEMKSRTKREQKKPQYFHDEF
jgi:hypothetical protein